MKYSSASGFNFSRFSLGTVQLGLNYGIANSSGKPSAAQAEEILNCAMAGGVNNLDTAALYGDSEEVIGGWLKNYSAEPPFITTKLADLDFSSPERIISSVREKADECRARLGLATIPLLMLHHIGDYTRDPENVTRAMNALKTDGIVQRIGISLYAEDDLDEIARSDFDAVQLPLNIFDWRLINSGALQRLAQAGKLIFVRSVFLQGLIFKNAETLEPNIEFCAGTLRKFEGFCKEWKLEKATLAASFVLSLPGVTSVVLGCETGEQVRQNCKLLDSTVTLNQSQMDELKAAFSATDPRVIDPRCWNK